MEELVGEAIGPREEQPVVEEPQLVALAAAAATTFALSRPAGVVDAVEVEVARLQLRTARDVYALEGLDLVLAHEAPRGREQPRVGTAQPLMHGEHADLTLRLAHLMRVRPRAGVRPRVGARPHRIWPFSLALRLAWPSGGRTRSLTLIAIDWTSSTAFSSSSYPRRLVVSPAVALRSAQSTALSNSG